MPKILEAHHVASPNIRREIGRRLRAERERLGLTQQALADHLGLQRQALFLYESGERSPLADKLHDLADLGGDVAFIITGVRGEDLPTPKGERELELAMSTVVLMCRRPGVSIDELTKLRLALGLARTMRRAHEPDFSETKVFAELRGAIDAASK